MSGERRSHVQKEHSDLRKEEIITACEMLYDKYHFKDITITDNFFSPIYL